MVLLAAPLEVAQRPASRLRGWPPPMHTATHGTPAPVHHREATRVEAGPLVAPATGPGAHRATAREQQGTANPTPRSHCWSRALYCGPRGPAGRLRTHAW